MRLFGFIVFSLLFFSTAVQAQAGYDIQVSIKGYEQSELYLAYHLGDKQYIKDTVQISKDGTFHFKGDQPLEGGVYLVVMAPDNNFFQVLVDGKNQRFSVNTVKDKPASDISFTNSADNNLFYEYLAFINSRGQKPSGLEKQ